MKDDFIYGNDITVMHKRMLYAFLTFTIFLFFNKILLLIPIFILFLPNSEEPLLKKYLILDSIFFLYYIITYPIFVINYFFVFFDLSLYEHLSQLFFLFVFRLEHRKIIESLTEMIKKLENE